MFCFFIWRKINQIQTDFNVTYESNITARNYKRKLKMSWAPVLHMTGEGLHKSQSITDYIYYTSFGKNAASHLSNRASC